MRRSLILVSVVLLNLGNVGRCERIKDVVDIQGVRSNPLTGTGLVIGLAGTGDTTLLSRQVLTNILRSSGLVVSPAVLSADNIAVVMVTAELGPFAREGSRIDVDVSTIRQHQCHHVCLGSLGRVSTLILGKRSRMVCLSLE